MLKDYGQAQCRGRSGTIGLNGWYAQGRLMPICKASWCKISCGLRRACTLSLGEGVAAHTNSPPDPTFFKGYLMVNPNAFGLQKGHACFCCLSAKR